MTKLNPGDRIFRYIVAVTDDWQPFELFSDPVHVSCEYPDQVEFWAVWRPPPAQPTERWFRVIGTGNPSMSAAARYWGTTPRIHGLVWHLIERVDS